MRVIKTSYRVACMRRGVPLPPPPDFPPIPASCFDYWMSEKQCTVTEWVGQLVGTVLPISLYAPLPPSVAPDPPYYNTRPVARTTRTGGSGSFWRATGLPVFFAAGSFPWMYHVGREVAPASGQSHATLLATGGGFFRISPHGPHYAEVNGYGGPSVVAGVDNALPHRCEAWIDGTSIHLAVDDVHASAPCAVGLSGAATAIHVGTAAGSGPTNATHAFIMLCTSKPTDAEVLALNNWVGGYYGV